MNYLERNATLLAEIRKIPVFKRGNPVGKSKMHPTTFTSLGSYDSELLGRKLFLGIKEYFKLSSTYWDLKLAEELSIIEKISKSSLVDELPIIYGHLRRGRREQEAGEDHIGVLCEDFSMGGRHPVEDIHYTDHKNLPTQLREVFGASSSEMDNVDFLCYVGFMVNGKRRLGDFDTLLVGHLGTELQESGIFDEFYDNIEDWIVRVDKDLDV